MRGLAQPSEVFPRREGHVVGGSLTLQVGRTHMTRRTRPSRLPGAGAAVDAVAAFMPRAARFDHRLTYLIGRSFADDTVGTA